MSEPEDRRAAGMAKMQEVYGFSVDPASSRGATPTSPSTTSSGPCGPTTRSTCAQRRLLTIGVLAAQDKPELLELQFDSALERGELTVDQVREVVVHLTHYVGWPISLGISTAAEKIIRRRAETAADASSG